MTGLIIRNQRGNGTLLTHEWRQFPSNYDIPANSQIFGHIVHQAGIEGILYPSKLTGSLCLVVFPKNFVSTDSYLKLDDEVPHEKVPTRIDASNWRICDLEAKEVIG
ncbi:RES family NAD+ phosphorylase [Legionella sp.]|uniref:RES family NAD+ phosphorylase n=1 Tax=Legionella sp. TaxID=459 RepID=UPI003D0AA768